MIQNYGFLSRVHLNKVENYEKRFTHETFINMINVNVIYGIQINDFLMKNKVSSSLLFFRFLKILSNLYSTLIFDFNLSSIKSEVFEDTTLASE